MAPLENKACSNQKTKERKQGLQLQVMFQLPQEVFSKGCQNYLVLFQS